MPDRFVARLNTYYLDIIKVTDNAENALADHKFPYSKRNQIEHLGADTLKINVECVFTKTPTISKGWTTDTFVFPTYEEHFFFKDLLRENRENLTFAHPKYGEHLGKVKRYSFDADDTDEFCRCTFEFWVERQTEEPIFDQFIVQELAEEFRESNETITDDLTAEETAAEATDSVSWTAQANTLINTMDAYLSSITSPANSIIYQINYGTTTPGLVMESINGAVDRIVEAYTSGRDAPASFINNIIVGVRALKATVSGVDADRVHVMGASRVAYEAAVTIETDDENARQITDKEDARSFDIDGNYKKADAVSEVMTLNELDASLAEVKKLLNEGVQIDRNFRTLQEAASRLQKYVNKIKFNRERIEETYVEKQSMHSVTLKNKFSYQTAERLLKINPGIKNPNFVQGNIDIIVPATA